MSLKKVYIITIIITGFVFPSKDNTALHLVRDINYVSRTDIEPPLVTCPDNAVASLESGERQAVVAWPSEPTATDIVDGNITFIMCKDDEKVMATSGELYSIGNTTVTCTAQDSSSNAGMCAFTIAVSGNGHEVVTRYICITFSPKKTPQNYTRIDNIETTKTGHLKKESSQHQLLCE